MSEVEEHRQKLQEIELAEVRDPPRAVRVITMEEAEDDLMEERHKLDVVTLNEVAHDLNELNGALFGKSGQGGALRAIQSDLGEIKADLKAMEKRHDEELARVCAKTEKNTHDIHAAHDKLRTHGEWIDTQKRGVKAVWGWIWKVLAGIASGLGLLWAGSRFFGGD